MIHMELSLEALLKQARGTCKTHLASYKQALDKGTQPAVDRILQAALDDAQVTFSKGLGIDDPKVLAQWASEWSNYDLMLSEFMLSVPNALLRLGLMRACIDMTDNGELLMPFAQNCIKENLPKKLEALYEAGYRPALDAFEIKDFLRVISDVSQLRRELFLPFVEAAIETCRTTKLVGNEFLMAMIGRYLGCRGGAGATYQAFKQEVWPTLKSLDHLHLTDEKMPSVLQAAVAEFTTVKTVGLLKVIASDCRKSPMFLLDKAIQGGRFSRSFRDTHNPYEVNATAPHIPVEILPATPFFTMINNDSMNEDFMCHTLPRLLESKQAYQEDSEYLKIRDRATDLDIVDLMLETPSIAERAAILHIMCLDNDKFDALFAGQHGKAALLVFEDRLPHYLEASGRRPYAVADYFRDISEFSVQDIHADEAYLDSAKRLTADFTQATIDYSLHLVEHASCFDKAKLYLESLKEVDEQYALRLCEKLAINPVCPEKDPRKLMRTISWENESIMADALSEDLGL